MRRRLPLHAVTLHAGVLLLTLIFLAMPASPARSASGLYFVLVLVPALQVCLLTFLGWRASLLAGLAVMALTAAQTFLPARPLVAQPVRWAVAFTSPDQALLSRLAPPPGARAADLIAEGGAARLNVCRQQGPVDDLEIRLNGTPLAEVKSRPTEGDCWLQLAVPPSLLSRPAAPLEVTIGPDPQQWASGAPHTTLIGGYTRPPTAGGHSGGARFFDGAIWHTSDLSPTEPGQQAGRYYVELHVIDRAGHIREVWY